MKPRVLQMLDPFLHSVYKKSFLFTVFKLNCEQQPKLQRLMINVDLSIRPLNFGNIQKRYQIRTVRRVRNNRGFHCLHWPSHIFKFENRKKSKEYDEWIRNLIPTILTSRRTICLTPRCFGKGGAPFSVPIWTVFNLVLLLNFFKLTSSSLNRLLFVTLFKHGDIIWATSTLHQYMFDHL